MLELLVAVSLMVMLLGVLTFVFRQSAEAVGGATETVNVLQKARNFGARLGREIGASVEHYVPSPVANRPPILQFRVSNAGTDVQESGRMVEFLSQTLKDGVLDTWCVRYVYRVESGSGETEMGAVFRLVRDQDRFGENPTTQEIEEVMIRPVRAILFRRVPEPPTSQDELDKMPASLEVTGVFIDEWGGKRFKMAHQFYFPIYQGH
jgi:type II secretory pathway pseudopilin PulG